MSENTQAVQVATVEEDKGVMGLTMHYLPATGAAAVTAVGLAALSLALTVKSFKYVKSAF